LVVMAGCDSPTPTAEITATLRATIDPIRIDVSLTLTSGYPVSTPYRIEPEEHIVAAFQGKEVELAGGEATYRGAIRVDEVVADDELTVVFDRAELGSTAIAMRVPTPFVVTTPPNQPKADPVTITWSPVADERMGWRGDACDFGTYLDGPIPDDTGSLTIPPGVLASPSMSDCHVALRVDRQRAARLTDSDFRDGSVTLTLARIVEFVLTP
jgi:hypothetical protein